MTSASTKRLEIRIPPPLLERIDAERAASGLKQSDIIRIALDDYLTRREAQRHPANEKAPHPGG